MAKLTSEEKELLYLAKTRGKSEGLFLVEGEREISHIKEVEALYYAEESSWIQEMRKKRVPLKKVGKEVLTRSTYREGAPLAVAKRFSYKEERLSKKTFLLLIEGVEKPGNLGAILRSAEAAGVEGVIFSNLSLDPFHPNAIRASLGAFFRLPFLILSPKESKVFLEKEKMQIVVASPHSQKSYFQVDFQKPTCLVVGSEAEGVSPIWQRDTVFVNIPMYGKIDSLNVSVATAVLLYEVVRQRYEPSLS
jgi:TrmH family RNA methyltransferase